ncbi:MAG: MoaD/ThiS family protein [Alphaproteobacteria bacterium]
MIALAKVTGRRHSCVELADGATPDDLLTVLDLPDDEPYMTLINGLSVAPGLRAATRLVDGDKVIVFPPLKGG